MQLMQLHNCFAGTYSPERPEEKLSPGEKFVQFVAIGTFGFITQLSH